MKKNRFLLNKYTVTVFILLAYFAGDVLLHKGMSRVLFGSSFTDHFEGYKTTFNCGSALSLRSKK
jgi:hypothetical protein